MEKRNPCRFISTRISFNGCSARTRTQTSRTRICCATITPQNNLVMQSYCFVFKNTRKNKPFQTILELFNRIYRLSGELLKSGEDEIRMPTMKCRHRDKLSFVSTHETHIFLYKRNKSLSVQIFQFDFQSHCFRSCLFRNISYQNPRAVH